ncbi:hypothetical protein DPEC_G00296070 [Dallia pectoralis]|uniref:Uncharacterized protein n=1 Tax=Dallia pectoralis TaxID=75939 RepID=A0ACC2FJ16_DALPE|nr:hypothetical protein DPEC_G00296070 [Dallia pectoralis]
MSSEKRTFNSSIGGMGVLNSKSCRGTLSFKLISGGSLLQKQHRNPRAGRVRFRGGMVATPSGGQRKRECCYLGGMI